MAVKPEGAGERAPAAREDMILEALRETLPARMGVEAFTSRFNTQVEYAAKIFGGRGFARFHLENADFLHAAIGLFLRLTGLYGRGLRNAAAVQVETVEHWFPNLPAAFDGFRILQLSDLHADALPEGGAALARLVSGLDYDLCVLTGDCRFSPWDDYGPCLEAMRLVLGALRCAGGVYGVLGNHDFLEMVPVLESLGANLLLNESVRIRRGDAAVVLAGVDDPHFYGADDPAGAMAGADGDFTILLCHSPEACAKAAAIGVDLFLAGHTHGGQICLPGGVPIITNADCPRCFASGKWRLRRMLGYTSRGVGTSGVPVRFFCPPEVATHVLRRRPAPAFHSSAAR